MFLSISAALSTKQTHLCSLVTCRQLVRQYELAVMELVQQQHLNALCACALQGLAPQAA